MRGDVLNDAGQSPRRMGRPSRLHSRLCKIFTMEVVARMPDGASPLEVAVDCCWGAVVEVVWGLRWFAAVALPLGVSLIVAFAMLLAVRFAFGCFVVALVAADGLLVAGCGCVADAIRRYSEKCCRGVGMSAFATLLC